MAFWPRQRHTSRRTTAGLALTIILAFVAVLVFAQLGAAQEGTPEAAAQPPTDGVSPFDGVAPTDEELAALPPSIQRYVAAHTLPASLLRRADVSASSMTASAAVVSPNRSVTYTVLMTNNGNFDIPVSMTDELPSQLIYMNHECVAPITSACEFDAGTVTWKGTLPAGENAIVKIVALVAEGAAVNSTISNSARIITAEQDITRSGDITVGIQEVAKRLFMPFATFGLPPKPGPITLAAGAPNAGNSWRLSWTLAVGATGYEIHESHHPDFTGATPYVVGRQDSLTVTKQPEPFNVYYYRARSRVGTAVGPWSNVVRVVGGYRDDFDDTGTNWGPRRMTNASITSAFYENGRYVLQLFSRWDWVLASPGFPAPRVPYVIDYEAKLISQSYAHSAGVAFGGDWLAPACPPSDSFDDLHKHKVCFNHFYNTNNIFEDTISSAPIIKLLFERIDLLEWRPNDGGSPLKRIGDIRENEIRVYKSVNARDWNHYRVEVWPDVIKVYAGPVGDELKLAYEYKDMRWIGDPYFGFFVSTDLIENATWRFEYIQVMPLD